MPEGTIGRPAVAARTKNLLQYRICTDRARISRSTGTASRTYRSDESDGDCACSLPAFEETCSEGMRSATPQSLSPQPGPRSSSNADRRIHTAGVRSFPGKQRCRFSSTAESPCPAAPIAGSHSQDTRDLPLSVIALGSSLPCAALSLTPPRL